MSKTKYRKQNKIIMIIIMIIVIVIVIIVVRINNKTKVADGAYLSKGKKKAGCIIPTMNCYRING